MNAKRELLDNLGMHENIRNSEDAQVLCARVTYTTFDEKDNDVYHKIILQKDYTQEEYDKFLNEMDFDYDIMYEIDGIIWLKDGCWYTRDYDWDNWSMNYPVEIPKELIKNK